MAATFATTSPERLREHGFVPMQLRTPVKAAIRHRLRVDHDQHGYRAEVVLDA